ncbi:MAG: hypothetical protein GX287_07885 [Fusobacteria bacterium]|nr:hypothetical protein [Fusobacteriota bacterium]
MDCKKKDAYKIALILMALYFSLLETLIPKPFPWLKLGFANIAPILGIKKLGIKEGIEINILRILIQSFMTGTLFTPTFFISFISGTVSILIISILFIDKNRFSTVAISSVGGFFHNVTQLLIAYVLLFRNIDIFSKEILYFVLIFSFLGVISGIIIGVLAEKMFFIGGKNGEKVFWN